MAGSAENESTARATQWLLSATHLLLALAAFVLIWVQLSEWPFGGRLAVGASRIRSAMTTELRWAAVVVGGALVVLLVVRITTGRAKLPRGALSIAGAFAVSLLLSVLITLEALSSMSDGMRDPYALIINSVFIPTVALTAAVAASPLAVLLVGAANALFSGGTGPRRCDEAADGVAACLVPLMVLLVVLPPIRSAPAAWPTIAVPVEVGRKLGLAATRADVEAVKSMLRNGAAPDDAGAPGYTPLIAAVLARPPLYGDATGFEERQLGVVNALLEAGADASRKDPNGKTALDHARERGLTQIANRLAR